MAIASSDNQWVTTPDGPQPQLQAKAEAILQSTLYCTLATCSTDGLPWASPVFFTYDPDWTLYWSSAIAAVHSQNIEHNQGRMAVAVYSTHRPEGKGQGLYLRGTATVLPSEQVATVMQRLFARAGGEPPQRTAADYLSDSPRRIYRFQPQGAWLTGERLPVGNQLVDTRVQVPLPAQSAG